MELNDTTSASHPTAAARLPLPDTLKAWLVSVRKPALSLQYRIDKRHVPDMDAEAPSSQTAAPQTDTPRPSPDSTASPAPPSGKNSDLMTVSGDFTIRYFDLGVGMLGILLAGCLFRGCCRMKRHMK